jgi:shikimate dehydrogenase
MFISGKARVMGVFGFPVEHSLSPAMHNAAIRALGLDCVYVPFSVPPESIPAAVEGLKALGILGVNVTIPHKQAVIPFMDEVEDNARMIGSVNTIVNRDGKLIGSSTDGAGFLRSLTEAGFDVNGCKAVVLGAGGAGRAVSFALVQSGAKVTLMDEIPERAAALADDISSRFGRDLAANADLTELGDYIFRADLVVNCTPVGMSPNFECSPVPADMIRRGLVVYDLVYTPLRTKLLRDAESVGALAISGVKMLVYQGALSFEKWTGISPPIDVMEQAVLEGLR